MTAAQLILDVLRVVCEFLADSSDVLSFALVCSSFRPVATIRLIQMDEISLTTSGKVDKFHSFLFADAPARARHVRTLNINVVADQMQPTAHTDQARLIDILTSCRHLTHLSISIATFIPPDILRAISSLRSLRSLSIHGPSESLILAYMYELCHSLCTLAMHFPPMDDVQFWSPKTMEMLLLRFPQTLQELKFGEFAVDQHALRIADPIFPPAPSNMTQLQYSGVRSLHVGCFVGHPLLGHLQHLFPALDRVLSIARLDAQTSDGDYADLRATNRRTQGGEGASLHPCAWKKLDRLVCTAPTLYILGLHCPVRLLQLNCCPADVLRFAADALRENLVPRLKLSLLLGDRLQGLDALCGPELAGVLTHLTLELVYSGTHEDEAEQNANANARTTARLPWSHFLDKLIPVLRPLHKLAHLRVVLQSDVCGRAYTAMADSDEFLGTVRGDAFDFAGTSASLARSLSSLRFVFLTTRGEHPSLEDTRSSPLRGSWDVSRGWRVAELARGTDRMRPDDGGPELVELHEEIMATLIRTQELVLSDDEEIFQNRS